MSERIFKKRDDSVEEIEQTSFKNEEEIQTLIARQPELIIPNDADYELLLIKREMGVPEQYEGGDRWSLDHLFVGSDIKPTLVEVKQSSDSRIYREVIGQMMDYAANGSKHWTKDVLKNALNESLEDDERDVETAISELVGNDLSQDEFWKQVHSNLRSGNIRLVFVSDEIPNELKTTIEFMSEQMESVEVYGVNLKKYKDIYTSDIISSSQSKSSISREEGRQWDKESFLDALEERNGIKTRKIIEKIMKWCKENEFEDDFGNGKVDPSYIPNISNYQHWYAPVIYWGFGRINIQFQRLKNREPFNDRNLRIEMLSKFNEIQGVDIDEDRTNTRPAFQIDVLSDDKALNQFINILEWFADKVRSEDGDLSEDDETND